MTIIRSATILAPVLAIAAALTPVAAVAHDTATASETIKLDVATLGSGDDADTVRSQIVAAAHRVCRPLDTSIDAQRAARTCFAKAIRTAEAQYVTLRQAQLATGGKPALAAIDPKPVR